MIQLYCSVESTTAKFTWTRNNSSVVVDVPHLRVRTCNDSTTTKSVLTLDGFVASDNGVYQCVADDGHTTGNGALLTELLVNNKVSHSIGTSYRSQMIACMLWLIIIIMIKNEVN